VKGRWRLLLVLPVLAAAAVLIVYRGPDWHLVHDAFAAVAWEWVVAAIGLNLLSVLLRAFAWETTIKQSIPRPHPAFPLVFSAFSVGLFANAVLPGRVGELARVAVLRRRIPGRRGTTATLVGSVFAHRMFDLIPALTLVIWVIFAAKIPGWALTSIAVVLAVGSTVAASVGDAMDVEQAGVRQVDVGHGSALAQPTAAVSPAPMSVPPPPTRLIWRALVTDWTVWTAASTAITRTRLRARPTPLSSPSTSASTMASSPSPMLPEVSQRTSTSGTGRSSAGMTMSGLADARREGRR